MRDPRTDPQPGDTLAGFSETTGVLHKIRVHFIHKDVVYYGKWKAEDSDQEPENSELLGKPLKEWQELAPAGTVISVGREKVAA